MIKIMMMVVVEVAMMMMMIVFIIIMIMINSYSFLRNNVCAAVNDGVVTDAHVGCSPLATQLDRTYLSLSLSCSSVPADSRHRVVELCFPSKISSRVFGFVLFAMEPLSCHYNYLRKQEGSQ